MEHLIVILMFGAMPVYGVFIIHKLRSKPDPLGKIKTYISIMAMLWLMTALILTQKTPAELLASPASVDIGGWKYAAIGFILLYFAATSFLPILLLNRDKFRADFNQAFRARDFIYPKTYFELGMFSIMAITVGICEEVLYRGFLMDYLIDLGLPLIGVIAVSSVLFGIIHFQQGKEGVIHAAVTGLLLACLYILTGSLILPILIHILLDLKIVILELINKKYSENY